MKFALIQLNNKNEFTFYKEVSISPKLGERLGKSWFGNPIRIAKDRQERGVHAAIYICSNHYTHNSNHQRLLREELFPEVEMPKGIVDLAIIDL